MNIGPIAAMIFSLGLFGLIIGQMPGIGRRTIFRNKSRFVLTYEDQLRYNIWLAERAHERGLSIGLKNDMEQILDLLSYFDWALNEQCFEYDECETLSPFIDAGKAAGCRNFFIDRHYAENLTQQPDFTVNSLAEAVQIIVPRYASTHEGASTQ